MAQIRLPLIWANPTLEIKCLSLQELLQREGHRREASLMFQIFLLLSVVSKGIAMIVQRVVVFSMAVKEALLANETRIVHLFPFLASSGGGD